MVDVVDPPHPEVLDRRTHRFNGRVRIEKGLRFPFALRHHADNEGAVLVVRDLDDLPDLVAAPDLGFNGKG